MSNKRTADALVEMTWNSGVGSVSCMLVKLMRFLAIAGFVAIAGAQTAPAPEVTRISILEDVVIHWDPNQPETVDRDGFVIRYTGQAIEKAVQLPAAPLDQRDAQRITLHLKVEPVEAHDSTARGPSDRWTRLGAVHLRLGSGKDEERIELMRFITGFGGASHFEQDLTPLAPMLHGKQNLELFISTYSTEPAWRATMWLEYTKDGVGMRRPIFAQPLFFDQHVTAENPTLTGSVTIPPGLALPRLRIITTGHATDGAGGDEFVSRTHVLRIDGRVVAVWRPWSEEGGTLRSSNPTSGRRTIDGRELWSSDLDRTGWHPGQSVDPTMIPVPELTPGKHTVELTIQGIRPKPPGADAETDPESAHHGYWVVSGMVVADEPWPNAGPPIPANPAAKPPVEHDAGAPDGRSP